MSTDWISSAVSEQRLFAIEDKAGHDYYSAFYADPRYGRRQIEEVAQRLRSTPSTVKYHFFPNKAFSLENKTQLEALESRLDDVLRTAAECVER